MGFGIRVRFVWGWDFGILGFSRIGWLTGFDLGWLGLVGVWSGFWFLYGGSKLGFSREGRRDLGHRNGSEG